MQHTCNKHLRWAFKRPAPTAPVDVLWLTAIPWHLGRRASKIAESTTTPMRRPIVRPEHDLRPNAGPSVIIESAQRARRCSRPTAHAVPHVVTWTGSRASSNAPGAAGSGSSGRDLPRSGLEVVELDSDGAVAAAIQRRIVFTDTDMAAAASARLR
jgi:hypothetical protein